MRHRISKTLTLRNAPLGGVRQIGSNMTEVEHGDLTVLYSYETPVAVLAPEGMFITEKKWSVTTSKHIGKFFAHHRLDKRGARKIPQDVLELVVNRGKLYDKDFPINVDPTPAEKQDMFERLTRQRGNRPRRTARRRGLIRDMRFFREHSGGSSRRGLDLARAEREASRRGWVVTWEPDNDADLSWMDDEQRKESHEVYVAVLWDTDPSAFSETWGRSRRAQEHVLASLGGIVDPDQKYMRVVEAELASEALARV